MAKSGNRNKRGNYYKPNAWGAIRDIWIAAMNKGQFPLAIVGVILLVMVLKLPSDSVKEVFDKFLDLLSRTYILGWVLSLILTLGWLFSAKYQRRVHTNEMKRVTDEKTDLQKKLTEKKLGSSN